MSLIDLPSLIDSIYSGHQFALIRDKLENHGIYISYKKVTKILNEHIVSSLNGRPVHIGHLASYLLTSTNRGIRKIVDLEERKLIEDFCGSISHALLKTFLELSGQNPRQTVEEIMIALKDTCDIYRYDLNQVILFLKLPEIQFAELSKKTSDTAVVAECPSLVWKADVTGGNAGLGQFIDIFVDRELIKGEKRKLQKLFNNPTLSLGITMNGELADEILYIIHLAAKHKLIGKQNSGSVYQVFEYHVLDFRGTILKNKSAKERINSIKNSSGKHSNIQAKMKKWFSGIDVIRTLP